MTAQALQKWQDISALLDTAASKPGEVEPKTKNLIISLVNEAGQHSSPSFLQKLVESKLPVHILKSCSRLSQAQNLGKTILVVAAAGYLLQVMAGRCTSHQDVARRHSSSTLHSLQQQVQASGLVLQLPTVLTVAADHLDMLSGLAAVTPTAAAAAAAAPKVLSELLREPVGLVFARGHGPPAGVRHSAGFLNNMSGRERRGMDKDRLIVGRRRTLLHLYQASLV